MIPAATLFCVGLEVAAAAGLTHHAPLAVTALVASLCGAVLLGWEIWTRRHA